MTVSIEDIARTCHEVNRVYCKSLGDHSQPAWKEVPDWQRASAIDGVLFLIQTKDATPESSHENWLKHKEANGWVYGLVKDETAKTHPCMVPYEELPEAQRFKDDLFHAVVRSLTK